ncbi:hypothetical protein [Baekduia sp. Peel2402]|uniref:hypothetical protein n=1 Tax=Baekduia sp. Peel2402 TaxID=3458296 RepID=UPI00403EF60D
MRFKTSTDGEEIEERQAIHSLDDVLERPRPEGQSEVKQRPRGRRHRDPVAFRLLFLGERPDPMQSHPRPIRLAPRARWSHDMDDRATRRE